MFRTTVAKLLLFEVSLPSIVDDVKWTLVDLSVLFCLFGLFGYFFFLETSREWHEDHHLEAAAAAHTPDESGGASGMPVAAVQPTGSTQPTPGSYQSCEI